MKEIYICARCGFVSTIGQEFVSNGLDKNGEPESLCTSCASELLYEQDIITEVTNEH